jgi:hypothetical protein
MEKFFVVVERKNRNALVRSGLESLRCRWQGLLLSVD